MNNQNIEPHNFRANYLTVRTHAFTKIKATFATKNIFFLLPGLSNRIFWNKKSDKISNSITTKPT